MEYTVKKNIGSGERGYRLGEQTDDSGVDLDTRYKIDFAFKKANANEFHYQELGRNETDPSGYQGNVSPSSDLGTSEHILKFINEAYIGDRVLTVGGAEGQSYWRYKASQTGFYYFKCFVDIELTTGWGLLDYATYFGDDIITLQQYKNGVAFGHKDYESVYVIYVDTSSPPPVKTTLGQQFRWKLQVENLIYLNANDTTDFRVNLYDLISAESIAFTIKGYVNHFLYALPEMTAAVIP